MNPPDNTQDYLLHRSQGCAILTLVSPDGANILTLARVRALHAAVQNFLPEAESGQLKALIITGNEKFFSAGADLNEIARLTAPKAFEFSKAGQHLTSALASFPVPVFAGIRGYCMGGGMDLALACHARIAAPNAVFGHRGTSLGLITGWGGTQRLPRLIGKANAMQMFLLAEMVAAPKALEVGLVDAICTDPIHEALARALRDA
ncbi:MAG TPA: enoyl-CoA hydratase/isomerase family protein [Alphaproteobacteria bacterium]|nr:enoyl-CoA hydratase/isomerase family protein [Alphaproteobacteria bacterium]